MKIKINIFCRNTLYRSDFLDWNYNTISDKISFEIGRDCISKYMSEFHDFIINEDNGYDFEYESIVLTDATHRNVMKDGFCYIDIIADIHDWHLI